VSSPPLREETPPQRLEVYTRQIYSDGRARRALASVRRALSADIQDISIVDVILLAGVPPLVPEIAAEVFSDAVAQELLLGGFAAESAARTPWDHLVEITVKPGVTDPVALTAREALRLCLPGGVPDGAIVQTAVQYLVSVDPISHVDARELARFFHNPLIQSAFCISRAEWDAGRRPPFQYPHAVPESPAAVRSIDLAGLSEPELAALSRQRLLALSVNEMQAVQRYFGREEVRAERRARGLADAATDVELEMIAQTWSEHCKHKIFNATIRYREAGREETIHSLFRTHIRATTEAIAKRRRFLRSVFHDNSGVISFDRQTLVCFKVETHNSPSALDPYGGAITGIVGVNRDIMGTGIGAKPIFNTDVLCFADPATPSAEVPQGLLHPARVLEGVHRGIVDGGNQSGIPVVAGAFLFDESYLGKPLVFCGTGGVLPARVRGRDSCAKRVRRGDLAVMTGGRIGKDGIHGATFSSEALSESSPTSAVQIGDPITQKKMLDMLLEARDLGLYRGLTDNGAGGLSSSLGEMATLSGGVRIDLDLCPLKYQGLAAWEILVSESQERMSLAVPRENLAALLDLAARRDVEATVVGVFTDTGRVEVMAHGALVGLLDMDFLHNGLPTLELRAEWPGAGRAPSAVGSPSPTAVPGAPGAPARAACPSFPDLRGAMLDLLADANIASREEWVRQYDHEVQGRSVIKPFVGHRREAPSDGGVLRVRHDSHRGITVTHGICPRYGDHDTYDMAQCAVDEAVRAHVALGGDPQRMSALDNFCWPDPVESSDNPDGPFKLAQLVRACRGLADACRSYQLPLISGKDSMKNDARVGGCRISIRPTLLVSLLGIIEDVRQAQSTDLKAPEDLLFVVGETRGELGGTCVERLTGEHLGACPSLSPRAALTTYRKLHRAIRAGCVRSCHDLSDGGLWVALAESCLGGELGARIALDALPIARGTGRECERLLFCETPSRFLVSVAPADLGQWRRIMTGVPVGLIGSVTADDRVSVQADGRDIASVSIGDIRAAWTVREVRS
jgi:phosphoribosylformylglycinamidine synthase II